MTLKKIEHKKIVVGLSGGIDSAVALILLKQQGWQPIGVFLKLPLWQNKNNTLIKNIDNPEQSLKIARDICQKINIPFYAINAQKEFEKQVIEYSIKEWKNSRTPNPCIVCNPNFKFKQLINWAQKHKIHYIATGHYANAKFNAKTKLYELYRPKDLKKDQTYNLCFLSQKILKYTIFPLSNYTKQQVYQAAKKQNLKILAQQKESKDICFVANQSFCPFLEKKIGKKQGIITDLKGNALSFHQGLHFFTLGQRKGIKLSNGPYYVAGFNKKKNILLVTKNKKDLLEKEILVFPYHLISGQKIKKPLKAQVQIRYQQKPLTALLIPGKNKLKIIFSKPALAPCPGQFAVFYQKNKCLGGGKII